MREMLRSIASRLLNNSPVSAVRRNHALEHATIHLLSARVKTRPLAGRADFHGFYLYGDISTQEVEQAAREALSRLQAGEKHLAIHPNCGTNLLTAGTLAGLSALMALSTASKDRWRDRLERLPLAISASVLALIIAQPLGAAAQRHVTTDGDPGSLEIVGVQRLRQPGPALHRILTRG